MLSQIGQISNFSPVHMPFPRMRFQVLKQKHVFLYTSSPDNLYLFNAVILDVFLEINTDSRSSESR